VTVFEHEFLTVPQDPGCQHNPFVDGAIVRYFPSQSIPQPGSTKVLIAPAPERPINKGLADASLLAHLFMDKQGRHLPYYRQEAELERFGWPISRGTMAQWQFECGSLVRPLVDAMWQQSLERSWFAMDATGTAIRASPKYARGHVFVLVAEGQSIVFRFSPTYDGATVEKLFGGKSATILSDASSCHNGLFGPGKGTEAACWAHARRRFVAAFRAREGPECAAVLRTMQALFRIERDIAHLDPVQRLEARTEKSAPLVENLLSLAKLRRKELTDDDSLTRKGYVYLDNQRRPLREFLTNGELPISNNLSERELRRHVKGRVNWLFHGSEDHARSACALSSLVASAELHGLDPEFYLQEILTVIPSYPVKRVLELAPENWLETRQRLITDGTLKYFDLARATGCALTFRPR
jgi:transposase